MHPLGGQLGSYVFWHNGSIPIALSLDYNILQLLYGNNLDHAIAMATMENKNILQVELRPQAVPNDSG